MHLKLKESIIENNAKVGIIGMGYVGLPLAVRFAQKGFYIYCFDIDMKKIEYLNNGKSYIKHIKNFAVEKSKAKYFFATSSFEFIKDLDVIIICVPTPLGIHNEPDLSYIKNTLKSIEPFLKSNQLLILESTTYPGTTDEEIASFIDSIPNREKNNYEKKFAIGENFFLGYSPEREDPGNKNFSTKDIPKIVSGYSENCLLLTNLLYSKIVEKTVPVSSTKVAEMTKILENIHRAVNIGLMNELKMVSDKMNINLYEVIEAASTKPFGFTPYYPGPGLGGHCIPIDPFYLTWKAKEVGMHTRFIELAGEINTSMPMYVVNKSIEILNEIGKSVKGSKILILGLSYKKNIDDTRESPSFEIIKYLIDKGANVSFSDPFFESIPKIRKFNFKIKNVEINKKSIKSFDVVILATDHDSFDYKLIEKEARLILDTRGRFKSRSKVHRA